MNRPLIRIDRSIWLRGTGNGELHRYADGMECCIGQACRQLGVPVYVLTGSTTVTDLLAAVHNGHTLTVPPQFIVDNPDYQGQCHECGHELANDSELSKTQSATVELAYSVNDDQGTTDAEKEEALVPLFNDMGLDVEFFN